MEIYWSRKVEYRRRNVLKAHRICSDKSISNIHPSNERPHCKECSTWVYPLGAHIDRTQKCELTCLQNPLNRPFRTKDDRDVMIRIIKIRDEDQEQLNILRKLATSPNALRSSNHTLPMIDEVQIGHLVFGVFPFVGATMTDAWDHWPENSVGDILDMFIQALEVGTLHHSSFYIPSLVSCIRASRSYMI